jgi:hypothetical protein
MSRLWTCISLIVLVLLVAGGGEAFGQCMLANPSFELRGSGATIFGGWSQFGSIGYTTAATHGSLAARVTGPNTAWGVSGYWQQLDTAPGESWAATVNVSHSAASPLTGQSRAILNLEWRDASGNLISYESHAVADPTTPTGVYQPVSVESSPAPTGTTAVRILLGVLQAPGEPVPIVYYDQATFDKLGSPTLEQLQWSDFSGGRTISFSGRTWRVKGPGYLGPGPNLFGNTASSVWVDTNGRLHLTVKKLGSSWYSSEVALQDSFGYGDYIFTTVGRLDTLDPAVVFGLFLWEYGRCYDTAYGWWNPYNEIDVEFSHWGVPGSNICQYVAQPFDYPGNLSRFNITFSDGELTSHAFRWRSNRVDYRSWRGGPSDESPANLIRSWTYTGPHIPRPERPRVHLNLWQNGGPPSVDQEVVLDSFTFISEVPADVPPPRLTEGGSAARPNPFSARTTISFALRDGGDAQVLIYDVSGRLVRALLRGRYPAGPHSVDWDGRDEAGVRVASGLYFARVRAGGAVTTQRMILLE